MKAHGDSFRGQEDRLAVLEQALRCWEEPYDGTRGVSQIETTSMII